MRTSTSLALAFFLSAGCPGTQAADDAGRDASNPLDAAALDAAALDAPVDALDAPTLDAPLADAGACGVAQDARGEGLCPAFLGYAWIGNGCVRLGGCSCVGADCAALFATDQECAAAHPACPRSCGGLTQLGSPSCLEAEFCDYATSSACGGDDSPGLCTARPTTCPEPGGVPVCGCDGVDYLTECAANLAGTDAAHFGSCATPSP